jgi:hypothetical protein
MQDIHGVYFRIIVVGKTGAWAVPLAYKPQLLFICNLGHVACAAAALGPPRTTTSCVVCKSSPPTARLPQKFPSYFLPDNTFFSTVNKYLLIRDLRPKKIQTVT